MYADNCNSRNCYSNYYADEKLFSNIFKDFHKFFDIILNIFRIDLNIYVILFTRLEKIRFLFWKHWFSRIIQIQEIKKTTGFSLTSAHCVTGTF